MTRYLQLIAVAALVFLALMFVAPVDAQRQVWSNAEFKGTVTGISGGGPSLPAKTAWFPLGVMGDNTHSLGVMTPLTVYCWSFPNPYSGGVTLSDAVVAVLTAQAGRVFAAGIGDASCNKLGQNDGLASMASAVSVRTTFTAPIASTASKLTFIIATDATTGTFNGPTVLFQRSQLGALPSLADTHFTCANPATQPGGTGTTVTIPATCGTRTAMAGALLASPGVLLFNNN